MDHDIAQRWIAELLCGKWKQGKKAVLYDDENNLYDPFGVLCKLYIRDNGGNYFLITRSSDEVGCPPIVGKWAGLKHYWGMYGTTNVVVMGRENTFEEIAAFIEQNWKKL